MEWLDSEVDDKEWLTMISSWNEIMFEDSKLPMVYTFKYRIGDIFYDPKEERIIEINDYNYDGMTYRGNIKYKIGEETASLQCNIIFEGSLNKLERYDSMSDMVNRKKNNGVIYKIHYVDLDPNNKVIREKVNHTTITMTNIRALAKMLNSMIKRKPNRKIVLVSIVDDRGVYLTHVKFLRKEMNEQKFLTGMKERLLAHAKYECGYEVATGF